MRGLFLLWAMVLGGAAPAALRPPEGSFDEAACIACHGEREPALVAAWRRSAHGKLAAPVGCISCHGREHDGAAARARGDRRCIACHGGEDGPVADSYASSKHGVLVRLEPPDWSRPLERMNYRAPGCAYCHMHAGDHDVSAGVRPWKPLEGIGESVRKRVHETIRGVCQDCHSPRYVGQLLDNGERMLGIGRLKVREAAGVLDQARKEFAADALLDVRTLFDRMRSVHLKNVWLGIAHQSPDYQWWHGQPALDGDLLRIKGVLGELRRLQAIGSETGRGDRASSNLEE